MKITHQYAQRYLGVAAIGEVSDLTPQYIRLISFKITEGSVSPKATADKHQKNKRWRYNRRSYFWDRNMLDSLLAQY